MVLAGMLDRVGVRRVIGESVRSLLARERMSAAELRELAASDHDGMLAYEEPEVLRRFQASMAWQALAWGWFVLGCLMLAAFFLAGNSPLRPGPAANLVFPLVMLATAVSVGNWAVGLGVGRGWKLMGRPGGANIVWLLVVFASVVGSMALMPTS